MPVSFAGLPTSAKAAQFVSDVVIRSGELLSQPTFELAVQVSWDDLIVPALNNGELEIIQVGDEKWIRNTSSAMTRDHRICLSPRTIRKSWGHSKSGLVLPPMYSDEQETRAAIRWTINRRMVEIIQQASLVPELAATLGKDPAISVACKFLRDAGNGGQFWFFIPPFFDDVGREYGETLLSYTSSHMVRNLIEFQDQLEYSFADVLKVLPLIEKASNVTMFATHGSGGKKCYHWKDILAHTNEILTGKWHFKNPWQTIRHALFFEEVFLTGRSGGHIEFDFRTSGPMILALLSGDRNMLADTNMFGVDDKDCRNTVNDLIVIPKALEPWAATLKTKDTAKPFVTQITYGQGPKGAVAGLFWKDDTKAPLGWLNPLQIPSEKFLDAVFLKYPHQFNPEWIDLIRKLGWINGYGALMDLATQYYTTFWNVYHVLQKFGQSVEKAGTSFERVHGRKAEFTNIAGWTYSHRKFIIEENGKSVRCRYEGKGCLRDFPKGAEFSVKAMKDIATPNSLVVRMTHQADAWIRLMGFFGIRKYQQHVFGRYVGHAAVHDAIIVPLKMATDTQAVIRPVLHQFVNRYVPSVHTWLRENGEDVKPLPKSHVDLIHWSIAHNKAWLNV